MTTKNTSSYMSLVSFLSYQETKDKTSSIAAYSTR